MFFSGNVGLFSMKAETISAEMKTPRRRDSGVLKRSNKDIKADS
ncbi:hypothetical protein BMS3Abin06_02870 [bacterium BMS3Abin06]|nr:hypothetical protein BMS3Abin06_02870 [bacterium BMS3Abin06]